MRGTLLAKPLWHQQGTACARCACRVAGLGVQTILKMGDDGLATMFQSHFSCSLQRQFGWTNGKVSCTDESSVFMTTICNIVHDTYISVDFCVYA